MVGANRHQHTGVCVARFSIALGLAISTLLSGCGLTAGFRPMGVEVSNGKFKAKTLSRPDSRFSKHHLLVRGVPGLKPPVNGARVKQTLGELAIHELPPGMSIESAMPAYQAAAGVKAIERLELFPLEQEPNAGPNMPAIAVPQAQAPIQVTNDPRYFEQWSHMIAEVPAAWSISKGNPNVVVASLDTGADYNHPDLIGNVINGPDFATGGSDSKDIDHHGTHVAGIIAAHAGNGVGVAGIAPESKVLALRIFEPYYEDGRYMGTSYNALTLARAIQYAATEGGAKIINISAGISNDDVVSTMLSYARARGLIICVSAGNKGSNTYTGKAKYMDGVLAVHATDAMDRLARFSNFGNTLGISAPGANILSTVPTYSNPFTMEPAKGNGYDSLNGTSMASPFVAGVAALVVSALMEGVEDEIRRQYGKQVTLRPEHIPGTVVEDLLRLTCTDLGVQGRDEVYGAGRVNAGRALDAAMSDEWISRTTAEVMRNLKR